jgi:hypothetical protein
MPYYMRPLSSTESPLLLSTTKSPYQLLHDKLPDIDSFKVFGSLCYSSILQAQRSKLLARARKSVFLGYSVGFKGSVLLDIHSREIHISRHVQFHEHILPYPANPLSITTTWTYFSSDTCTSSNSTPIVSPTPPPPIIDPDPPHDDPTPPTTPISPPNLRKSSRTIHPPSHLQDYICNNASGSLHTLPVNVKYSISDSLSYTNVYPSHCAFSLSIDSHIEPTTYDEASKHICWQQAMQAELIALENTGTWKLVDLPPHIKPIGCRWIYKIKHHADGTIERYKV